MSKVLITTVPFGLANRLPIDKLTQAGIDFTINPLGRKLNEDELCEMAADFDVIIAGTEPITAKVMSLARRLRHISRVGVGLDNVDLVEARRRGIKVSYTAEAPAPAVAEFTIGLMLSLLRSIHVANTQMHRGEWERQFGRSMSKVVIGIVGAGRIGGRVLNKLAAFGVNRVLVNDIHQNYCISPNTEMIFERVDKNTLYREADVISIHVPLTKNTQNMVCRDHLLRMKKDAMLINTSRGGIINEQDLAAVMHSGHLSGAAIDVFFKEPYSGELAKIDRCLLTSHMGSMSVDCRSRMEIEATEEAIRFLTGEPLQGLVPNEEYIVQS